MLSRFAILTSCSSGACGKQVYNRSAKSARRTSRPRLDIVRYHRRVPDVLIRDVPAEDIARIDAHAARLGLSRTEYLRRRLRQDAARPVRPVTATDLQRFSSRFASLSDTELMRRAWS